MVGGLAEPFHSFQFLPHGLHVDGVHLLLGGQQVNLALPCLGGDFLAAVLQFLQIPGRRVIEDQFPAVALLEQFPFLRLFLSLKCLRVLKLTVFSRALVYRATYRFPAMLWSRISFRLSVRRVVSTVI